MNTHTERLQKVLAAAGLGSRRSCEQIITDARVQVNGSTVTRLGTSVSPDSDEIRVDGKSLKIQRHVYFVVNKPRGYLCTNHDEFDRPRVVDLIARCPQRVYTVGRLDEETEGIILVTNDGALANRIAHPRYKISKVYLAKARGRMTDEALSSVRKGMHFSDGKFKPHSVTLQRRGREWTRVLIHLKEGRNREIRRLFARLGHPVLTLKRDRIGGLTVRGLKTGGVKRISREEVEQAFSTAPIRPTRTRHRARRRKR